uniref:Uncharacterized protein n=1 Tax=Lynx canadensis TaxID=61383 RepID=A0A667G478_LYNCA
MRSYLLHPCHQFLAEPVWLFLPAHSHPQDHPFSQAPKWFSRPLVLPGTLAAGRRARGLPRPPRSFAVAANSPHLGFIYSSHPLL